MRCEYATEPEALYTPDPIVNSMEHGVVINFIIDEYGRVDSPIVLEPDDSDQSTLQTILTVKRWRFRPAKCDGVPVETEAAFQFTEK